MRWTAGGEREGIDDRLSVFLILVAQICDSAQLARLPVCLTMGDGTMIEGHPLTTLAPDDAGLQAPGYEDRLDVAGRRVRLSDVAAITVRAD